MRKRREGVKGLREMLVYLAGNRVYLHIRAMYKRFADALIS